MNYLAAGLNAPLPLPDGYPRRVVDADGPYLVDRDGGRFIDLWTGYGALLLGHRDPQFLAAAEAALQAPWYYGSPSEAEERLATRLHETVPCAERVRFGATGADAVMYAIRISRAATGRTAILAARGGYHGAIESPFTRGGIAHNGTWETRPFNDAAQFVEALATQKFAACIVEPVLGNNGCVPPHPAFLKQLRDACSDHGTVFILDEVMTGIRLALGGGQELYGVVPDLCTMSKAIAGGLPLSVVAGRRDLLERLLPSGDVFFSGTFYGLPTSLAVALHLQERLADGSMHRALAAAGDRLRAGLRALAAERGVPIAVQGVGSMFSLAFTPSFESGVSEAAQDEARFERLIVRLAGEGVLLPPMSSECAFLSAAHVPIIEDILAAFGRAFEQP